MTDPHPIPATADTKIALPRHRWGFRLLYLGFLLAMSAVALNLVRVEADVWDFYYPELVASGARSAPTDHDDGTLDILTLGGSVLYQAEAALEARLRKELQQPIRCYHLSTTAHTTRDSLLKYQQLENQRFDLVIVCHGINDIRMTYWPSGVFRTDYSHCAWYANLGRDAQGGTLSLWDRIMRYASQDGLGPPNPADFPHGAPLQTAPTFAANLSDLVSLATRRRDRVLLLTMASYLPANYTRQGFEAGTLDYGPGDARYATELWGEPVQVAAGISEHNKRTREVAHRHAIADLVDLEKRIASDGGNFSDICHLTTAGQQRFVNAVVPNAVRILQAARK